MRSMKLMSGLAALVFVTSSVAAQPAGTGSIRLQTVLTVLETGQKPILVKHRKYKRREPKASEVIAGAILLGILGAAAASGGGDYHYDYHYDTSHEDYIRRSDQNCRQQARKRYRLVAGGGKIQANTRRVAYLGGNRYEVRGRVRRADGSRARGFVCRTRLEQVRRLNIR